MKTSSTLKLFALAGVIVCAGGAWAATFTNTVTDVNGKVIELEWTYSGSTLSKMTNLQESAEYDIEIPTMKDSDGKEYTITTIGNDAFRNNSLVKSVTMPSVLKIEEREDNTGAFTGCSELTDVVMTNVTSIGRGAFRQNKKLVNVEMPNVKTLERHCFYLVSNLAGDFEFNNLETVGEGAFAGTAITSIKMPSVTSLGNTVFDDCANLTTVVMPKLQSIGKNTFQDCTMLVGDLVLPELTTVNSEGSFRNTRITSIELPLVRTFAQRIFREVTTLTNVVLSSVKTMKPELFQSCTSLEVVKMPWCMSTVETASGRGKPFNLSGVTNFFLHAISPLALKNLNDDGTINTNEIKNILGRTGANVSVIPYGGVATNEVNGVETQWFYDDRDTPGYALSEKEVTIVASTNATGSVVIPDRALLADGTSKKVTAVGSAAFYYNTNITTIRLGKYVTRAGKKVFKPTKGKVLTVEVPDVAVDLKTKLEEEYASAIAATTPTFVIKTYKTATGFTIIVR